MLFRGSFSFRHNAIHELIRTKVLPTKLRKLTLGVLAGLLSAPLGLIAAYAVGVVLIGFKTHEFLATLLAAGTVLPLMLLFVLTLPTTIICILSGLTIASISAFSRQPILMGAVVGLILAEIVLTFAAPLVVPGDFTSIVSRPLLSGSYGLLLGVITGAFFQLFIKWNTPRR